MSWQEPVQLPWSLTKENQVGTGLPVPCEAHPKVAHGRAGGSEHITTFMLSSMSYLLPEKDCDGNYMQQVANPAFKSIANRAQVGPALSEMTPLTPQSLAQRGGGRGYLCFATIN